MTIPATVVQNVPLNGRDFTQLIATAPGYGDTPWGVTVRSTGRGQPDELAD